MNTVSTSADNVKNKRFRLDPNKKARKGPRRITKVISNTRNHKKNIVKILVVPSTTRITSLALILMKKMNES